ncbi:MAG: sensor domain-containing diguanylate cyclase [Verrucomicrobia bacterium]|nr:sensor domain-containing diguanylate cyclase [Verrucomicrobiota bacterium]
MDDARGNQIESLTRITRAISDGVPFEEALHVVVEEARKALPFDAFAVVLLDEETEHLFIKFARRISDAFVKRYRRAIGTGATARLLFGLQLFVIAEADARTAECAEFKLENDFASLLCAPIVVGGGGIGYLHFERALGNPFTEDEQNFARLLAGLCAAAREMCRLREQNEQLTYIDPVTQALKGNAFLRALRRELDRAAMLSARTGIGLLDLDNFRPYCEIHGLKAGRQLLADVTGLIKNHIKGIDLVGRLGLDDLIFTDCNVGDRAEAERLFEAIRRDVEALGRTCGEPCPVASIGGAIIEPGEDIGDFTPIMLRLRHALHRARDKGGNQVLFVEH